MHRRTGQDRGQLVRGRAGAGGRREERKPRKNIFRLEVIGAPSSERKVNLNVPVHRNAAATILWISATRNGMQFLYFWGISNVLQ